MPRGKKTPPETIYAVMTSWAVTDNYAETARNLKIPEKTVEKIVKDNKDKPEFAELCAEKKNEFCEKASRIIRKALDRLEKEIDGAEHIPVSHLTTAIGTLHDKKALIEGNATEKVSVEVILPKGIEEYAG